MLRQPINIYGNVKVVARFGWLELLVLVLVSKIIESEMNSSFKTRSCCRSGIELNLNSVQEPEQELEPAFYFIFPRIRLELDPKVSFPFF
jgi:hypothetical protein